MQQETPHAETRKALDRFDLFVLIIAIILIANAFLGILAALIRNKPILRIFSLVLFVLALIFLAFGISISIFYDDFINQLHCKAYAGTLPYSV